MNELFKESLDYIVGKFPLYRKTFEYISDNYTEDDLRFGEVICQSLMKKVGTNNDEYIKSMNSLIWLSVEYLKYQSEFIRSGKYHYKTFNDVNDILYQDKDKMNRVLNALFLSQTFWPNHYKIIKFFRDYMGMINPDDKVLEIPCGTGVYSAILLANVDVYMDMYDISPYAIDYSKEILDVGNVPMDKVNIEIGDIRNLTTKKYNHIICGQLIENLDNPAEALNTLYNSLIDKGTLFLTTSVYAAGIDHIKVFNNVDEIRNLLIKCGFEIVKEMILPLSLNEYQKGMTNESMNYACILKKNINFISEGMEGMAISELVELFNIEDGWVSELGAADGIRFSNVYNYIKNGWSAVMIDGFVANDDETFELLKHNMKPFKNVYCHNAYVNLEEGNRLEDIYSQYPIPYDFNILSLDVDGIDYWIWKSLKKYKPKIVAIEYNLDFVDFGAVTVPYDKNFIDIKREILKKNHRMTRYQGASPQAILKLAEHKGYIATTFTRNNIIFLKEEVNNSNPPNLRFSRKNMSEYLRMTKEAYKKTGKPLPDNVEDMLIKNPKVD